MTQIKKLFLSLLVGFSVAQGAPGQLADGAKGDNFEAGQGPGHGLREALKSMDLTEEQRNKIKEIRKAGKEASKEIRSALKTGRKTMEDLMKSHANKDEIISKFESIQTMRNKMARARFDMMLAVREILTPEQRQKLSAFLDSPKGRRGDH